VITYGTDVASVTLVTAPDRKRLRGLKEFSLIADFELIKPINCSLKCGGT